MNKSLLLLLVAVLTFLFGDESIPRFENRTGQAGIDVPLLSGAPEKPFIIESMSGGVGLIDYDNDGWLDIYLVNGSTMEALRGGENPAKNRLFHNNRNGTFSDVTDRTGVGDTSWGMGICAGDVNNDGWVDIYVTNFGPNLLYLNNGDGTFRDFSKKSGTDDPSWSASCAFGDYDLDGDLDLYVTNYVYFEPLNPPLKGPNCQYRGISVQCGPKGMTGQGDRFYENQGDGHFVEKSRQTGIAQPSDHYGLGVVWGDYNNDGYPDIYVANDSMPNFLFRNNRNGTFTEVGLLAGVALNEDGKEQAGMGVDFSDFDNDGDLDIVVTNFSDDANSLYRNDGEDRFVDISYQSGLGQASWQKLGFGTLFADLNLDGWEDLVVANGHVYPQVDNYQIGTSFRQLNSLFLNQQNGQFKEISEEVKGFQEVLVSRGLASGDINNDGHLDLLFSNLDEIPTLLINRTTTNGNWILLKLEGTRANRSAIGARVRIKSGDLVQMKEVKGGNSYLSQSDFRLHFGLGKWDEVEWIRVRWPGGKIQELSKVDANQILEIREK